MIVDFAGTIMATKKRNINQFLSVCAYFKDFANGIKYIKIITCLFMKQPYVSNAGQFLEGG